ncbi:MAG: DnaJ domain-containing protein [Campylobacterota bacterium]|nr:DnaJ domain-containing protein [Campylobacterota bacterium]
MKKIIGLAVIALGVFLEVMWLGFCFGSIIIGILLLIFAPRILFFPFTFFLLIGLTIIKGREFTQSAQYKQYSKYGTYSSPKVDFAKYYEILESKETDSIDVIKKNYRRLIKEYHYDSLASQNLSPEMLKLAEEKTQSLNEAYSAIKESKKV